MKAPSTKQIGMSRSEIRIARNEAPAFDKKAFSHYFLFQKILGREEVEKSLYASIIKNGILAKLSL
jgi:hypothetical protein